MDNKMLAAAAKRYVQSNKQELLTDWMELIRHKSISATGEGVEACCDWLKGKMETLQIRTTKYPVKPYPVLVGRYGADPAKKTVLVYGHYDVKPAGDLSLWKSDPFEPDIRDGKVYARGSADNKSPVMAHLKALEYYEAHEMEVPVNLIFLFEGCEEAGSVGLPEFLQEHFEELQADLVFFSDGPKDPSGLPIIALGAKGDLTFRLTVQTMNKNVHARYAPVLPNAAWLLVDVLHRLKQGDKVLVPGFYEGIVPFTAKEREILDGLPDSEETLNTMYQARPAQLGKEFYPKLMGEPTFNICWIKSGANGIIPAKAEALIDVRLVAGQEPAAVFGKIKSFVDSFGMPEVSVEMEKGTVPPSKTPVETPYLPVIETICKEVYGEYVVYPCRPSSAPDFLWTNILKLPAIQVRWSDADSDNHAPNEHLSIKEYLDGIVLTICVWNAVGAMEL